jgi:hypothetical protein
LLAARALTEADFQVEWGTCRILFPVALKTGWLSGRHSGDTYFADTARRAGGLDDKMDVDVRVSSNQSKESIILRA